MSDKQKQQRPPNTRLWEDEVRAIKDIVIPLVIKFLGPQKVTAATPPLSEHPAIWLRNSVVFRAGSLGYHVDLLRKQYSAWLIRAHEPRMVGNSTDLLYNAQQDLTYLADDVLFNAVSLLDYVANLVGYVFTRHRTTLQWSGMAKAGRDSANPLSAKKAAQLIAVKDRQWVGAFYDVRAMIIHNKALLGDGSQSITFTMVNDRLAPTTLSFPMDRYAVKRLKFLKPLNGEKNVQVVGGTEQLALATLETSTLILRQLLDDIGGPLVPKKIREPGQDSRTK